MYVCMYSMRIKLGGEGLPIEDQVRTEIYLEKDIVSLKFISMACDTDSVITRNMWKRFATRVYIFICTF